MCEMLRKYFSKVWIFVANILGLTEIQLWSVGFQVGMLKSFFFQKSIIVSLKSIFYRLSWRHYCSSTNAVLHVMSGRNAHYLIVSHNIHTTHELGYCTGSAYIYIDWENGVKFSASLRSRLERLRREELISELCAVPSLELDSISMGDLTETLMFAVYRSPHCSI